ncbi:MAG: 50S ribosomal protein L18 [Candidatus Eremiobacteraeota bacterium]|nr:50S ribosomal protein L18 [Candidatus Eremiobacteraeota bacterium]MBC5802565.1 50S ribosomal protein L18 [Candidatus Eremiobacteraeota bacterium]MBC5821863.1 50S ribosomal protein L18 [Candidatus Eremiobacteraeota bacterium]
MISRTEQRLKRHSRLRRKVIGTAERPRLQIHRTLHHIYATVVDDARGHTLAAASTRDKDLNELGSRSNVDAARKVGEAIGRKAKAAGIDSVVFDTSGLKYHGRVAALADAARAAGLEF